MYERPIRLLAQYAFQYIQDALEETHPPHSLEDMTTYRLENLDNLEEVVDGVLADQQFASTREQWRRLKQQIVSYQPCVQAGSTAFAVAYSIGDRQFLQDEATAQQVGMGIARNWSATPTAQMWFFEGWLQAREEEM